MRDGYDQSRTRTSCSRRSPGPPTATACSRSATSSATATGSTGCWESNCLFVPRKLLEQVGRLRRGVRDGRAAATPTSTLRAPGRVARTSRWPRSSARARSTRCTGARPPTCARRPSDASASSPTASTTRSCAAAASRAREADALRRRLPHRSRPAAPAARRMTATAFAGRPGARGPDGAGPGPEADGRRAARAASSRRTGGAQAWRRTRWLGHGSGQRAGRPVDLPGDHPRDPAGLDHRDGHRRRRSGAFLASICDLEDLGRIVSVDRRAATGAPATPAGHLPDWRRARGRDRGPGAGPRRTDAARRRDPRFEGQGDADAP